MRPVKKRKQATVPAILAGILVLVALSFLIFESRTVGNQYYVSHADRIRTIETIETDIATIVETLEIAYDSGRDLPASVQSAFDRLSQNNERLQGLAGIPRASPETLQRFVNFGDELDLLVATGQAFLARQNAMAEALQTLQDDAPVFVRELRDSGLSDQSQTLFVLAIDLIEFATRRQLADGEPLLERIGNMQSELVNVQAGVSERTQPLLDSATTVVNEHVAAGMTLEALTGNGATGLLSELADAIFANNRTTVRRAELAEIMLSLCAVLLLLGVAFALIRLQASYRDLNRSNAELEDMNSKLEERVAARTALLTETNEELVESQTQLIHAEKMSSLGRMVAGISHEINTPLWYLMSNSSVIQDRLELASELCQVTRTMTNSVKSRTNVKDSIQRGLRDMHRLLENGIEEDIEEARNLIQDSIFGLDELTSLAQGLKDFSRLDRAIQGQFNVNEGLDKALLIASNRIKNRIEVHKYYGDIPSIYCSPSQINQIFLNLLTNAADAISGNGDLVIRTWEKDGNVGVSISDSGAGIPDDVLPNIRDPFFTTKEVGSGTGLGLSIVDQIVTKHRGELSIESEPGNGTCVTVMLPISESDIVAVEDKREDTEIAEIDLPAIVAAQRAGDLPDIEPKLLSA